MLQWRFDRPRDFKPLGDKRKLSAEKLNDLLGPSEEFHNCPGNCIIRGLDGVLQEPVGFQKLTNPVLNMSISSLHVRLAQGLAADESPLAVVDRVTRHCHAALLRG